MARIYTVTYTGTLTNTGGTADFFELVPADDKPIRLRGFCLAQSSELGDAAEENLGFTILHLAATVTSGDGTSVTPTPVDTAVNVAAGFAAECNGPTVATSSGTTTTLENFAWNIRSSPYERWYPDRDFCPTARQASGLFVRCTSTPTDDITIHITAWVEEE